MEYLHQEKESFQSKFLKFVMSITNKKYTIEKRLTTKKYSHIEAPITTSITKNFNTQKYIFLGKHYWEISSKRPSGKIIYYIHGGGYVNSLTKHHWNLIEQLVKKTGATIFVPDYPLSPIATHKEAHTFIDGVYIEILKKHSSENVIFMGDSAGGGLALAYAMTLRNEKRPQPQQLILLSPWLDITMQNTEISPMENYDKMLSVKGLKMAGEAYAKDISLENYRVSPIFGDFKNLPPISFFIGTHDIFIADNRKLKNILKDVANDYHYFEYPKMFHVWTAVVSLPESKKAIEQICNLILKK